MKPLSMRMQTLLTGMLLLCLLLLLAGCVSTTPTRPLAVPCPAPPEILLEPIPIPPAVRATGISGAGLSGS